ncbi:MAG: hypothetical protein BWY28_02595 [bacterium ADurb.Bin236]|nr:MAG: hypothetical protein BWY28_02595 [bacterium ADurb.Bin236]
MPMMKAATKTPRAALSRRSKRKGFLSLFIVSLSIVLLMNSIFAAAQEIEDISQSQPAKPTYVQPVSVSAAESVEWLQDNLPPEDITPLKSRKRMITLEAPPEADKAIEKSDPPASAQIAEPEEKPGELDALDKMLLGSDTEKPSSDSNDKKSPDTKNDSATAATTEETEKCPAPAQRDLVFPPSSKRDKTRAARDDDSIRVYGSLELNAQTSASTGNGIAFLSNNGLLYYNDKLTQRTRINVDGTMKNGLSVDGSFVENPYQDNEFYFKASGPRGYATVGDTSAQFKAGPMAEFRKTIRGLDAAYDFGSYSVSAFASRGKSETARETFRGRNIRGPYALRSHSIMEGSESVTINNRRVPPSDYSVDYFLGQITFNRNIDPSEIIEITYESVLMATAKTGALTGFSAQTNPSHPMYDFGAAYVEEGVSRAARETVFEDEITFEPDAAIGVFLELGKTRLVKQREAVTMRALVPGGESTTSLKRGEDYEIDWPAGRIKFLSAFPPDMILISVYFEYYNPDYLQWVSGEELRGTARDSYVLGRERVYGGTEVAELYLMEALERSLIAGVDYEINEANNSIDFLDTGARPDEHLDRHVVISYEIVPPLASLSGDHTRSVADLTGRLTLGPAVLRGEYAESSSDMTLKSVQVLEERVATVGAADVGLRVFYLRQNAISNTEEIYLNDTFSPGSRQRSGTDYVMEYDTAADRTAIRFQKDLPAGTTIIASYKHAPSYSGSDSQEGKAARATADVRLKNGSLSGEYMRKSWFFAPMNQYNDLESERLSISAKYLFMKSIQTGLEYSSREHGRDFSGGGSYETRDIRATVEHRGKTFRRVGYSLNLRTREDVKTSRYYEMDENRASHRLEALYVPNDSDEVSILAHIEKSDFNDDTDRTSDYFVSKGGVDIKYDPEPNLKMKLSLNKNEVKYVAPDSISAGTDSTFKTITNSGLLDVVYIPDPLWVIMAKFDTQMLNDMRPGSENSRVDNMEAIAKMKPGTKTESVLVSFSRQKKPNPYYGDSLTEASTGRIDYRLNCKWLLSPRVVYSKTLVEERSGSVNRDFGARAMYTPGGSSPWTATLEGYRNRRTSSRAGSTTSADWTSDTSNQDRTAFSTRYFPGGRLDWKTSATFIRTSGASGGETRSSYTTGATYAYSPSTSLRAEFNTEKSGPGSPDRVRYLLESETLLDKHFTLSFSLKKDKQTGSSSAYDGTLFNLKLRSDF